MILMMLTTTLHEEDDEYHENLVDPNWKSMKNMKI